MEATDTAKNNGISQQSNSNGANKQPQDKAKKARKLVGIPTGAVLSSMTNVFYTAHVAKDPVNWDAIENYQPFSPAADGSRLMIKVSKTKAVDLRTRKSSPVGYGQAYPVDLSTTPSKPDF
ncbi:hypothetical protein [Nostoc sp. CHAB 5715]|uniref:hypothetical protein n=1 Tax=Nostoc sp. CHAB 5715 TaxID=2780400 RepID=UPI001E49F072|nr:hypothetical protein [Nostoc sp. CHAB 5715]MCC5621020.1 hypothetical protein [Nostoc sp. CHAB 5715]